MTTKLARVFSLAFLAAVIFPPTAARAAGGITAVWANDGGDKVTQDDLRVSRDAKSTVNSIWDGTTLSVFGAKNEVIGFNVILESLSGAGNVQVSFNKLMGPNGRTIASTPATGNQVFNFMNRNIELFYVRYLPIKGLSKVSYETYDERHVPQRLRRPWSGSGVGSGSWQDRPDHDKYYPDIAVPLELVPTFSIASGKNQSIWVDVYIPRDAAPGLYQGTLVIQENGAVSKTIPVQLKVYNFTLPDTPSAKTMLYYSANNINKRYLGSTYINPSSASASKAALLRDRHFLVAHRHRVSLIGDANECGQAAADQPCPEWGPRLDGSLFSAVNGYDGPGANVGNNVYSIGTYGAWSWKSGGQPAMNQHSDSWVNWFTQNSPATEYFLYLADESPDTTQMQQWAGWILANPGPGRALKSMATIRLITAATNTPALDVPTSTLGIGVASQWQPLADSYNNDARKRFYMYNAHRPATGSTATEDDGVALRELAWAQYKKHIGRWFFWESTYYNNYQGGMGETNVFQSAMTFGSKNSVDPVSGETGWNYSNGDGVLFYPGTDTVYPSDSYGVDGPFASLRLKAWRRGIEDVDYLTLASALNPTAVQNLVNQMVPKALWEYGVSDPNDPTWVRTDISWPINPDTWETARRQLAEIISPSPVPTPAPGGDTLAPSVPSNIAFTSPNTTTLKLSWGASTDDVGVAGYRIDLATDAEFTQKVTGHTDQNVGTNVSTMVDGLAPGITYYARARAYDAAGNLSNNTPAASMATLSGNFSSASAPTQVTLGHPTGSALSLSWMPSSSTSSFVVFSYQVQVSTLADFSNFASLPWAGLFYAPAVRGATLQGLLSGTLYYVRMRASDSSGHTSAYCSSVSMATLDLTPPSIPSALYFKYPNVTTLRLYWGTSTDNVGVAGYRIDLATDPGFTKNLAGYNDQDRGNTVSMNVEGLLPGKTYYARARAYDAAGNVSNNTAAAVMATLSSNFAAESAPVQVAFTNPTLSALSLSWVPSQSTASFKVTSYQVQVSTMGDFSNFTNQPWSGLFYPNTTNSAILTGLRPGLPYYARIRSSDPYGNVSNYSLAAPVTTLSLTGFPGLSAFASAVLDAARVYPNPWRKNRHAGFPIVFDQLTLTSTVKIFTVAGHWIKTLNASTGNVSWDLTNDHGDQVASGIYIYLITNDQGQKATGKLSVIR